MNYCEDFQHYPKPDTCDGCLFKDMKMCDTIIISNQPLDKRPITNN